MTDDESRPDTDPSSGSRDADSSREPVGRDETDDRDGGEATGHTDTPDPVERTSGGAHDPGSEDWGASASGGEGGGASASGGEGGGASDRGGEDGGASAGGTEGSESAGGEGRLVSDGNDVGSGRRGNDSTGTPLTRLWTAQDGALLYLREMLTSVLTVVVIGLLLFAVSGVWPPLVAVESGSMQPHMYRGDLVFVTEPHRLAPRFAQDGTGVVTVETGREEGYRTFGGYGTVVVYDNPNRAGKPIIHRAHLWVKKDENWYDRANKDYIEADNCAELRFCPAPYDAFITKGDNDATNPLYDQASGISSPVRPEWITGTARVRIPYLGWIRLTLAGTLVPDPGPAVFATAMGAPSDPGATP